MNLLAIDTSTERASVALSVGDAIYSDTQDSLRQHAQCLLPMIEGLLTSAAIQLSQLDGIVFGRGPGSFTGLRVACSSAKALAYAHDLPLYPVSSLASIADAVYTESDLTTNTPLLVMLDARMQQVYWAFFSRNEADSIEQVSAAEDISIPLTPFMVAGVGLDTYVPLLPNALQTQILKQRLVYPDACAMIRLVRRGQVQAVSADQALPAYVRELHFVKNS